MTCTRRGLYGRTGAGPNNNNYYAERNIIHSGAARGTQQCVIRHRMTPPPQRSFAPDSGSAAGLLLYKQRRRSGEQSFVVVSRGLCAQRPREPAERNDGNITPATDARATRIYNVLNAVKCTCENVKKKKDHIPVHYCVGVGVLTYDTVSFVPGKHFVQTLLTTNAARADVVRCQKEFCR